VGIQIASSPGVKQSAFLRSGHTFPRPAGVYFRLFDFRNVNIDPFTVITSVVFSVLNFCSASADDDTAWQ
jgi:hypothetical protein